MSNNEITVVEESKDETSGRHLRIVRRMGWKQEVFDVEESRRDGWDRLDPALGSLELARESARLSHLHTIELRALDRKSSYRHDLPRTPWGQADSGLIYGEGVVNHGTTGHGGFKLSAAANRAVPASLRNKGGWYEEDAEWAKVAFAFPQLFTTKERTHARRTLVNDFPHEFMALTGEVLTPKDIEKLAKEAFEADSADKWVVISALAGDDGMTACTATLGGKRKSFDGPEVEERRFMIPSQEYSDNHRPFGFVIDEARHEEVVSDSPRP